MWLKPRNVFYNGNFSQKNSGLFKILLYVAISQHMLDHNSSLWAFNGFKEMFADDRPAWKFERFNHLRIQTFNNKCLQQIVHLQQLDSVKPKPVEDDSHLRGLRLVP